MKSSLDNIIDGLESWDDREGKEKMGIFNLFYVFFVT